MAILTVLLVIIISCSIYYYFYNREKKLINRLQHMIDNANKGNFDYEKIDESMESSLENSLRRFLTDHELLVKNLDEQKKQVQTLVSDISHQTVTPISNILLYSQIIEEGLKEDNFKSEVRLVCKQAEKLSFLINSLVKASRLEIGIISVNPELASVSHLIRDTVNTVSKKAEEKNIEIIVDDIKEKAIFDEKWTREALFNIVDNAVKYTREGGHIHFSVTEFQMFIRIDVIDDGVGIAEENINKIFERFYRESTMNNYEGVGIGLYLARQIITAQNGYIKVKSELNIGSTFSVFLPKK